MKEKQDKKDKKTILLRLLYITFAVTLLVVWGQSTLSKSDSSVQSDFIIEMIEPIDQLEPGYTSEVGWTYVELSTLVRKLAHVVEYAGLIFQLMCIMLLQGRKSWKDYLNCFFAGMFVALVDETIQIFSNRGSLVSDIWVDLGGITFGILCAGLLGLIVRKQNAKKAEMA